MNIHRSDVCTVFRPLWPDIDLEATVPFRSTVTLDKKFHHRQRLRIHRGGQTQQSHQRGEQNCQGGGGGGRERDFIVLPYKFDIFPDISISLAKGKENFRKAAPSIFLLWQKFNNLAVIFFSKLEYLGVVPICVSVISFASCDIIREEK